MTTTLRGLLEAEGYAVGEHEGVLLLHTSDPYGTAPVWGETDPDEVARVTDEGGGWLRLSVEADYALIEEARFTYARFLDFYAEWMCDGPDIDWSDYPECK